MSDRQRARAFMALWPTPFESGEAIHLRSNRHVRIRVQVQAILPREASFAQSAKTAARLTTRAHDYGSRFFKL
jgi:hypothetical protein